MSNYPTDRRYTKTHEWVRQHDHMVEVGITDFAQQQLSDITYVELPETDQRFDAGEESVVIESIKAATDVYSPISGVIAEVNTGLTKVPETINSDPYEAGWLIRIDPDSMEDIQSLMTAAEYEESLPEEEG